MLFMNRLEFFCIFRTTVEYDFLSNPPVKGTENSIEHKIRVFCQIDVQEFHLWISWAYMCHSRQAMHGNLLTTVVFSLTFSLSCISCLGEGGGG
jgi:hypothetical protein